MLPSLRLGLCCALLLVVTRSHAADPPSPTQLASECYERGMARFRLDEFEGAIKEWEEGFRVKPAPEFLYNIAQAYRGWKKPDKALTFYRKYLDMDPKARNRPAVEQTISALEKQVQDSPPVPEPATQVASSPVVTTSPMATARTAAPPPRKPVTKRPWFRGVVGTGIVVVVGAVVVGSVLGTRGPGRTMLSPVTF